MTKVPFEQRVEAARERLDTLRRQVGPWPEQPLPWIEAIEELSTALEELGVAQEELHQQNEELIAARHEVESERRRYQELFDFAPDGYLVTAPGGVIQEANRAAVALLNAHPDFLVGKPLVVFVQDQDRKTFVTLLTHLEAGKPAQGQEWELYMQPRDRAPFPAALTVAPVHDTDGELTGLRWLLRDITSSKRAQEREQLLRQVADDRERIAGLVQVLHRERDTLQTIMENTRTHLAYLDPDFNFVRVNSMYAIGSGHNKEELIGRNHFDLFPNAENQAIFERVRGTGQAVEFHARPFEFADQPERGTTYWDWTLAPVKDGQGQIQGLVLSLMDVTESVRAGQEREQLLSENRRQRLFLEQLVEAAPIGIAVVGGAEHRYELVNPCYQAIPGMPGVPMVGRTVAEVFPAVAAQGALDLLDQACRTGHTVSIRESEASVGPGREQTYWNVDHVPLTSGDGAVDRVLILAAEVTEQVLARQRIQALAAEAQHQADEMEAIFSAMTDAVIVYDAQGIALHANPPAIAACGLDPVGMDRGTIARKLAVCYSDGRPAAAENLPYSRALRGAEVIDERLFLTDTTGKKRTVLLSTAPIFAGDRVAGVVLAWHDITAREQAEQVRNRLIAILEQTPDMVSTITVGGELLYLNRAARQILGIPEGADLATWAADNNHRDWASALLQEEGILAAVRHGLWSGETAVLSYSGREIPMSQVIVAHKGPDGSVEYLSAIARDVSERKTHLAQLEAERARFKAVIDHAPEAIIVADKQGRFILANPVAEQLYARPLPYEQGYESLAGLALCYPDGTPYDPRDLPLTRSALEGQAFQNVEMVVRWPDNQERNWLVNSAPIRDSQGQITGAVGVFQDITERGRTETALRESQEKLQVLFQLLPVGISVLGERRNVIEVNPTLERILGISREGLLRGEYANRRYFGIDGTPLSPEKFPSSLAFAERKTVRDVEVCVEREDGSVIWTLVSAVPLPFSDWRLLMTTLDITQRKRAEEALRESEEQYRRLFNGMTEGFALHEIVCDAEGKPCDYRFLEINPAFENLTGLKRKDVLGRTVLETLPGIEPFWIETYGRVALTGEPIHFEQYSGTLDRYYEVFSFRPAERQFATLFLNVTARKQAEEALQRAHDELEQRVHARTAELQASEERFRQLAEHIREVFWMSDAHFNQILYVSPVYEELTGLSCQSLYDRADSFLNIVHPEDRQHLVEAIELQFQDSHDEEYRIITPDGSIRWVRTRAFPIHNQAGEVYRIAGIADDITERVQAQQILEQRVEERTRELHTLLDISRKMALTLELEPMLTLILDQLRDVLPYDGATIFRSEADTLSALAHRGPIPQSQLSQLQSPLHAAILGREVMTRQQPIIIPDVRGDTLWAQIFRQIAGSRMETTYAHVRSWMGIPLTIKDQSIGLLALHRSEPDSYTSSQADLAAAFAYQAAIAIENSRLYEQAQALAAVEERQRLARELHDAVSQTLFSASLSAEVLPRLWERNPAEGQRCLEELHRLTRGALAEMRTLLLELRPSALTELGLGDLLYQLSEAITNRTRLAMNLMVDRPCPLPPDVQVALYRIAQEALNNVAKHAGAQSVELALQCIPASPKVGGEGQTGKVELRIKDDGHGFDAECIPPDCLGLTIMHERARAINAAIEIDSRIGHGTSVVVVWPETEDSTL
jgi:PAS domain S-box-containing protein